MALDAVENSATADRVSESQLDVLVDMLVCKFQERGLVLSTSLGPGVTPVTWSQQSTFDSSASYSTLANRNRFYQTKER